MLFSMLSSIFSDNGKHAAKKVLTFKAKLYDGSEVSVHLEDTTLTFKTAMGDSQISLRNIKRMENVSNVVTMRKELQLNKFEIHCIDGCKIVGVPKPPGVIHLYSNGKPHERGKIELWEIDWLQSEAIINRNGVFEPAVSV